MDRVPYSHIQLKHHHITNLATFGVLRHAVNILVTDLTLTNNLLTLYSLKVDCDTCQILTLGSKVHMSMYSVQDSVQYKKIDYKKCSFISGTQKN